jgi:hypothetical protein
MNFKPKIKITAADRTILGITTKAIGYFAFFAFAWFVKDVSMRLLNMADDLAVIGGIGLLILVVGCTILIGYHAVLTAIGYYKKEEANEK